jgi:hypothetical protein
LQFRTNCLDESYVDATLRSGLNSDGMPSKPCGAAVAVTKGVSIVDHRARFSTLSARYDDFLFAPVCEEANGMRLSVLSALARMNVDPWEEATRLAAMPKAIAEKALVSILDLACGRSWKPPEAQAIAARLVRLLPQPGDGPAIAATATAPAQRTSYWWVWLGFALAMSFMTPQHQATTTTAPAATSQSGATAPLKSSAPAPDAVGLSR